MAEQSTHLRDAVRLQGYNEAKSSLLILHVFKRRQQCVPNPTNSELSVHALRVLGGIH